MNNQRQRIEVSLAEQVLRFHGADSEITDYPVSTARNGAGELNGSECTPRGRHRIRAKIGSGCAPGTVFVGRRPTGEIYTPDMRDRFPARDWILTRIMWLCGEEPGFNRFGQVDTMRRYIYIHGAPDDDDLEHPSSHGCIKMKTADLLDLYERVDVGTPVIVRQASLDKA